MAFVGFDKILIRDQDPFAVSQNCFVLHFFVVFVRFRAFTPLIGAILGLPSPDLGECSPSFEIRYSKWPFNKALNPLFLRKIGLGSEIKILRPQ